MDDHELLRNFVRDHADEAFRDLVNRHVGMVYATSRRMVRDAHLAEEVTQNVFILLAQKAASLQAPVVLAGWLYTTSQHLAMHAVRTEQRRRQREEKAAAMHVSDSSPTPDQILEDIESAMATLASEDRDALVLRYFEDRSLREVGVELGVGEDAARMRVNRAVERLRDVFGGKGIRVTSVLLVSALSLSTATSAPAGLAITITATALAGAAAATATYTTISAMNWINAKSIVAVTTAAILAGTGTYWVQQQQLQQLRVTNAELLARQEQPSPPPGIPAAQTDELERLRSNNSELLQLRNEVGQLRQQLDQKAGQASVPGRSTVERPSSPRQAPPYASKEKLAYAGYDTPEAALQTIAWATMNGLEDQVRDGLSPELLGEAEAFHIFERNRKALAPLFRGMQMMSRKAVDANKTEYKVRYDITQGPGSSEIVGLYVIVPIIKTENGWKLGSATRDYTEAWDTTGEVEVLAQ